MNDKEPERIIRLDAVRRERERAGRDAARAAKRAAQPPREGIRPALYWGLVVALVFALAGGYSLISAL